MKHTQPLPTNHSAHKRVLYTTVTRTPTLCVVFPFVVPSPTFVKLSITNGRTRFLTKAAQGESPVWMEAFQFEAGSKYDITHILVLQSASSCLTCSPCIPCLHLPASRHPLYPLPPVHSIVTAALSSSVLICLPACEASGLVLCAVPPPPCRTSVVKVSVKCKQALRNKHIGMVYLQVAQLNPHVDDCAWLPLMDRRGDTQDGKLGKCVPCTCVKRAAALVCLLLLLLHSGRLSPTLCALCVSLSLSHSRTLFLSCTEISFQTLHKSTLPLACPLPRCLSAFAVPRSLLEHLFFR